MTGSTDDTQDLTPWFDGAVKPVHQGPYRRSYPAGPYSCWDGREWIGDGSTAARAAASDTPSQHQQADWRGLAKASGQPCATCHGHGVLDSGEDDDSGDPALTPCPDC